MADSEVDREQESGRSEWTEPQPPAEDFSDGLDESERRSRRRQFAIALLVLLVSLVALALRIRGHRHLTQIKSEIRAHTNPAPAPAQADLRPGGQDPLLIDRSVLPGSQTPEFTSATILPGRGMSILQITAAIPGIGQVSLLDSPSVQDAVKAMTGTDADRNGAVSTTFGAPFTLPWAGRIPAAPGAESTSTQWNGRTITLPATQTDLGSFAVGGLLLDQPSGSLQHDVMPDGGVDQGTYNLGNFNNRWPSQTQATLSIMLSGHVMDLTVTARNSGTIAEPIGIGWAPHFLIGPNRDQVRIHLPSGQRVEERANGQPTGRLLPVEGTVYDFTPSAGAVLGDRGIDACFVHLRSGLLDDGPVAELSLPDRGYGLRIISLSSNIRSFRIYAPAGKDFLSIQPNFNYDDPFGREWPSGENTGMVVLEPGQTVQWKIRLELFPPTLQPGLSRSSTPFDPPR